MVFHCYSILLLKKVFKRIMMKSLGEVKKPKEEKQNKNKQLSNENRLKKQKKENRLLIKRGGKCIMYT